jgi:hypothetical protein
MPSAYTTEPVASGTSFGLVTAAIAGIAGSVAYVLSLLLGVWAQEALFLVLATTSILLCISWVAPTAKGTSGRIDVFHPAIIVIAIFLVYFVGSAAILVFLNGYRGELVVLSPDAAQTVNATMALGVLSVVCFGIGARIRPMRFASRLVQARRLRGSGTVLVVAVAFLVAGVSARLYQLSLFGPIGVGLLEYLSPGRRRDLGLIVPQSLVAVGSMADWGALLLLLQAVASKRPTMRISIALAGLLVIATAVLSFLVSGKRSGFLLLVLPPFIWIHYLHHRMSIAKVSLAFIAGLGIVAILLIARIAIPLVLSGGDPADFLGPTLGQALETYLKSAELSTFDMVAGTLRYRDQLLATMGDNAVATFLRMTFETLSVFIPSGIWPDKPLYLDTGHYYFRYFVGSDADVGLAVTSWGTAYLFFGVIGVVVGFIALGWFSVSAFISFAPAEPAAGTVFLYSQFCLMFFQFLRFGTLGFTFLYFVQSIMMGVIGLFLVTRPGRTEANVATIAGHR